MQASLPAGGTRDASLEAMRQARSLAMTAIIWLPDRLRVLQPRMDQRLAPLLGEAGPRPTIRLAKPAA